MSIPASVNLYVDWDNGTYSSPTYTAAAPDVPVSHTYTFTNATRATEAGSPWNGQWLVTLNNYAAKVESTVSSATVATTSGRFLAEFGGTFTAGYDILDVRNVASQLDGMIRVQHTGGGNLQIVLTFNSDGSSNEVNLGTFPSVPFAVEVIYDSTNATANQRLRARTWSIGGSAGSMNNSTANTGSAAATAEFTLLKLGGDELNALKIGRVMFSDDIAEDLSVVSEGSAVPVIVHHLRQQGVL